MSQEKLKIAVVSHDITWSDKEENIITIAELLNRVDKNTDVVILPELCCSGFISTIEHLSDIAETNNDSIILNATRWAQFFGFAICGTFIAKENERYYNRAFFVEPSGDISYYNKRHLYSSNLEKRCFSRGLSKSPIIRFRGWNITMQICYDINFPVWCRNSGNKIDLLLVPANCPKEREFQWKHLLIARAIENQYYVVGANRSGIDDEGDYNNQSYIYDCKGKNIACQSSKSDKILYAELQKTKLETERKSIDFNQDADSFELMSNR